jgi:hypothetical protein
MRPLCARCVRPTADVILAHRKAESIPRNLALFKGGLDGVTPGSSCIANAYSNKHDAIASKDTGLFGLVSVRFPAP